VPCNKNLRLSKPLRFQPLLCRLNQGTCLERFRLLDFQQRPLPPEETWVIRLQNLKSQCLAVCPPATTRTFFTNNNSAPRFPLKHTSLHRRKRELQEKEEEERSSPSPSSNLWLRREDLEIFAQHQNQKRTTLLNTVKQGTKFGVGLS
jgi:hypothetical protein